jgi:serine palmitoyltransferase
MTVCNVRRSYSRCVALYRYDVATISSVIPAFAKGKDVIVCDSGVSYPIELGISLSRCQALEAAL